MNFNTMANKNVINAINILGSPLIEIVEEGSILVTDILKEINMNEHNTNIEYCDKDYILYENLQIIAIIETSPLLKDKCFETDIIYIYLMINDVDVLYIGMDYLHPRLWKKIETHNIDTITKELTNILNIYCTDTFYNNIDCNVNFSENIKSFIGTESMFGISFEDNDEICSWLEKNIIDNKFCEFFMWGSYWSDFPYRRNILNKKYNNFELNRMMAHALKQRNNILSLSVRTKASKSILSYEYKNGAFFLEIKYNGDNNNSLDIYKHTTGSIIPTNLPMDVVGAISNFVLIDIQTLYKINNITNEIIDLSIELIKDTETYNCVISELEKIKSSTDLLSSVTEHAQKKIKLLNVNKLLNNLNVDEIRVIIDELLKTLTIDLATRNLAKWIKNKIDVNNDVYLSDHIEIIAAQLIKNSLNDLTI